MKPQIILASQSIGRRMLLKKLGIKFDIEPSTVDEDKIISTDPYETLTLRARAKAKEIRDLLFERTTGESRTTHFKETSRLRSKNNSYLIIAADSMAILNGKTYGKATSTTHAKTIVSALMDQTHDFVTATTIIQLSSVIPLKKGIRSHMKTDPHFREDDKLVELNRWENLSHTAVTCRTLTESEIEGYVGRFDFTRFAACYALGETPWDWVTKIDGSYTNVIGLPFEVVLPILRELKIL